jgi:hypothetical protein
VVREQAAVETRALRREERGARLLELIADVGEWGSHGEDLQYVAGAHRRLAVARLRLRSALTSTGESLPACERLLELTGPS